MLDQSHLHCSQWKYFLTEHETKRTQSRNVAACNLAQVLTIHVYIEGITFGFELLYFIVTFNNSTFLYIFYTPTSGMYSVLECLGCVFVLFLFALYI